MASGFLQKQAAKERALIDATQGVMKQFLCDTLQITMHEQFGWGFDRIVALTKAWGDVYNEYLGALSTGTEADYLRECLDRHLADICRKPDQKAIPFNERYPEVKEITYRRGK